MSRKVKAAFFNGFVLEQVKGSFFSQLYFSLNISIFWRLQSFIVNQKQQNIFITSWCNFVVVVMVFAQFKSQYVTLFFLFKLGYFSIGLPKILRNFLQKFGIAIKRWWDYWIVCNQRRIWCNKNWLWRFSNNVMIWFTGGDSPTKSSQFALNFFSFH